MWLLARMLETLPSELVGAASGAFNTSRQLGGAIGVALFGILLGAGGHLGTGFTECMVVSIICIAVSTVLTAGLMGRSGRDANRGDAELVACGKQF
jgi:DHA2 family methylenomycin A resistance protein-like MFS transporter